MGCITTQPLLGLRRRAPLLLGAASATDKKPKLCVSDCLLAGSGTDWLTVNLSSRCTAEGNRIFLRVFGQSKIFSGPFGARQFRPKNFFGAFGASNNSGSPPPAPPPPPPPNSIFQEPCGLEACPWLSIDCLWLGVACQHGPPSASIWPCDPLALSPFLSNKGTLVDSTTVVLGLRGHMCQSSGSKNL